MRLRRWIWAVMVAMVAVPAAAQEFVVDRNRTLITSESFGSAAFGMTLSSQPEADVVLPISVSDPTEATITPQQLVFTPQNWNEAQFATLRGVDDFLLDGTVDYFVVLGRSTSADPTWNGIDPPDLPARNLDDDVETDLEISKRANVAVATAPTQISFTVTVKNLGPSAPLDVAIHDPSPPGTTLVENSGACTTSYPCTIGRIDPGEEVVIVSTYAVNSSNQGQVVNTAWIETTAQDSDPSNNSASAVVELCPTAPRDLDPAADTTAPTSGVLSWKPTGAEQYAVYLGPEGTGCSLLLGRTSESFIEYSSLEPERSYEWRVVATKQGCPGEAASPCVKFSARAGLCETQSIELLSPIDGAVAYSPVELSWTPVEGAVEYRLYTGPSREDLQLNQVVFREISSKEVDGLPLGTTYWKVEVIFDQCPPLSSPTEVFELESRRRRGARRH